MMSQGSSASDIQATSLDSTRAPSPTVLSLMNITTRTFGRVRSNKSQQSTVPGHTHGRPMPTENLLPQRRHRSHPIHAYRIPKRKRKPRKDPPINSIFTMIPACSLYDSRLKSTLPPWRRSKRKVNDSWFGDACIYWIILMP